MTLTMRRDHLIADWRDRLAAAETEPVGSSPRRAWLVRVRTRLYRFLLSLYGDGAWRADAPPTTQPPEPVVFDATLAEQLTGKPAKDVGKIRSVLKTVANSQDHRPAAGSLTADEVLAASWFAIASSTSSLDLPRCQALLLNHRIESRVELRGSERSLEVPIALRYHALELIEKHRSGLRKQKRIVQTSHFVRPYSLVVLCLFATPLVLSAGFILVTAFDPRAALLTEVREAAGGAFVVLFLLATMVTIWAAWRTGRPTGKPVGCDEQEQIRAADENNG